MKLSVQKRTWNAVLSVLINFAIYTMYVSPERDYSIPVLIEHLPSIIEALVLIISAVYFFKEKETAGFGTTLGHALIITPASIMKHGLADTMIFSPVFLLFTLFRVELLKGRRIFFVMPFLAALALIAFEEISRLI